MPNCIIIIQARNGSSRLPRKMVKPFYEGKSILQILIERLQNNLEFPIWLATTTSSRDEELVNSVKEYGINIFRGDEDNVFSRFTNINEKEQSKYFIRICGDNPFLHIGYLKQLVNNSSGYDYTSYYDGETPVIKTHYGIFAEVIRSKSFLQFETKTMTQIIKEHVTPFLYENENVYKINKISLPDELNGFSNLRLTVDTEEDFKLTQALYAKHSTPDNINYNLSKLLAEVKHQEEIQRKMDQQIKQNSK